MRPKNLLLNSRKILLCLTGGIACYKTAELTRMLIHEGAKVQIAMSASACRFITPLTMQALSGKTCVTEISDTDINCMQHITLSREADAIVVAPATANYIAKSALGVADDLISTLTLARNCPILIAPAMNHEMWNNPATQRNIELLQKDGFILCGPDNGKLACGEIGFGRMIEPAILLESIVQLFTPKHLANKRVIITAGPTLEHIDPVRVLTNQSSGKMGFALATAARAAGASVDLVTGPVSLSTPFQVKRYDVTSANQMYSQVFQLIRNPNKLIDIFIAVAAVCDWRPSKVEPEKLKKNNTNNLDLSFIRNPDILEDVAKLPNGPFCVGFSAESQNLEFFSYIKRQKKNIPLIIGNLIHNSIGSDSNTVIFVEDSGTSSVPQVNKRLLADIIIKKIATILLKNKTIIK